MILAATLLIGLGLFSAQVVLEWARLLDRELSRPWVPQPRCKFKPHPRHRVIQPA